MTPTECFDAYITIYHNSSSLPYQRSFRTKEILQENKKSLQITFLTETSSPTPSSTRYKGRIESPFKQRFDPLLSMKISLENNITQIFIEEISLSDQVLSCFKEVSVDIKYSHLLLNMVLLTKEGTPTKTHLSVFTEKPTLKDVQREVCFEYSQGWIPYGISKIQIPFFERMLYRPFDQNYFFTKEQVCKLAERSLTKDFALLEICKKED